MFIHKKELQFQSKPDRPDPVMARKLQEILGGQWGEMSVMNMYLFQGWNARGDQRYKDLVLDIGTEEIGHVEMIATMIARLLDDAPVNHKEAAYESDPAIAAVMGGMDPQHAIVAGLGATPRDSNGVPWSGAYITASGNLLADVRLNLTAESQGRLQVSRLYHMTDDKGVKDMLAFLLARDTYHQNIWAKIAKDLEEKNGFVVPANMGEFEVTDVNHIHYNFSEGDDSKSVVEGIAPDGEPFEYGDKPVAFAEKPILNPGPPNMHATKDATK
ncbi:manganese catalase family protein [Jeotgalibaca caeni]|uniref:manganese catalase family protein n=1 Tax=Jeotgalibaca caeni TaxID=3028623 RepID=UPI00237DB1CE|nr:manganese catalase family protein [Jeotgalibaca caeni]MDE1547858.1 manganese catalase family protein [Jeotgalibaca caeni]